MSVKVTGTNTILKNLEEKLGKQKATRVVNKTLNAAGDQMEQDVKSAVAAYADTGATVEEVVRTKSRKKDGIPSVRVGWNGPKKRYALVHLNEFGFTKNGRRITPQGYGVLRNTIDKAESAYISEARKGLEELAK